MTDMTIKRKDPTALPDAAKAATATTVRPLSGGFFMGNGQILKPEESFFAGQKVVWPIRHDRLAGASKPWAAPGTDHVAAFENGVSAVQERRRKETALRDNEQKIASLVHSLHHPQTPESSYGMVPLDLGMRSSLQ